MNTVEVAKQIKKYLVSIAVKDKLPADMTTLDIRPITKIIDDALRKEDEDNPTAFGFDIEDVIDYGREHGYRISKKRAREIITRMMNKGDVSVGISWDTVLYFIQENFGEWDIPVTTKKQKK